MKSSRLLFAAIGALAVVGCNAILGIDGTYTEVDDGGPGGGVGDGGQLTDATLGDGGPGADAGITDATTEDVLDAAPFICADGGTSPYVAAIGSACCANNLFACDQGQQLELLICDNGIWSPNGACTNSTLCRFDVGELPDGGAQNDGGIVGNGSGSGNLGTCVAVISACSTHNPGDIVCSNGTLVVCGADRTTAYEETCKKATTSTAQDVCKANTGPHCPQCVDGVDFACNGNAPVICSDGGYVQQATCGDGTYCHPDGTCANDVCMPGTAACVGPNGDTLLTCDTIGDMYVDAGTCDSGLCDNTGAGSCDVCPKGATYGCNPDGVSYTTCKADGTGQAITQCTGTMSHCYEPQGSAAAVCGLCGSVSDCTAANVCQTASCNGSMATGSACSYPPVKDGLLPPATGACMQTMCTNGMPSQVAVPDTPVTVVTKPDGTGCTEMICSGGNPVAAPAPAGTMCMVGGAGGVAGTCDGTGMDPTADCVPIPN